jgi:hypothetical protein
MVEGITVERQLLAKRCSFFTHHGDSLTFGSGLAVMCNSPRNGVQALELRPIEVKRGNYVRVEDVFQIRCNGCLDNYLVKMIRVDKFGNEAKDPMLVGAER